MAAIGRSSLVYLLALAATGLGAETPRAQVSYVASALTAGNPADAMTPFDKSFPAYEKLRGYFSGLTGAFQLTSQLEVTEEQDSSEEATLTVEWTLTLTDAQTGYTTNRNATIHARLVPKGGKWKIVEFSPIELFDPRRQGGTASPAQAASLPHMGLIVKEVFGGLRSCAV